MRAEGVTKLTINGEEGGVSIELGTAAPAAPAPTEKKERRGRPDVKDPKTLDEFLRDRFQGAS